MPSQDTFCACVGGPTTACTKTILQHYHAPVLWHCSYATSTHSVPVHSPRALKHPPSSACVPADRQPVRDCAVPVQLLQELERRAGRHLQPCQDGCPRHAAD